jgi:hypothetical protein
LTQAITSFRLELSQNVVGLAAAREVKQVSGPQLLRDAASVGSDHREATRIQASLEELQEVAPGAWVDVGQQRPGPDQIETVLELDLGRIGVDHDAAGTECLLAELGSQGKGVGRRQLGVGVGGLEEPQDAAPQAAIVEDRLRLAGIGCQLRQPDEAEADLAGASIGVRVPLVHRIERMPLGDDVEALAVEKPLDVRAIDFDAPA